MKSQFFNHYSKTDLRNEDIQNKTSRLHFSYIDRRDCYVFQIRRKIAEDFENDLIQEVARITIQRLNPDYGIGYYRNIQYGPTLYAFGVLQTPHVLDPMPDGEDGDTIARWGDRAVQMKLFNQGIMRNVYSRNYLNASQLNAPIGKQTMKQWIKDSPERGILEKVGQTLTCWDVAEDQVLPLRSELANTGLIFNWERYQQEHPQAWERFKQQQSQA